MDVLATAVELGQNGIPAALVTVIATQGSTPRHAGARMLVGADGSATGTIGGGRVELDVTAAARRIAAGAPAERVRHHLVRDMAMCCGGTMEFYLQSIGDQLPAFARAVAAFAARTPVALITPLDGRPVRVEPWAAGQAGGATRARIEGEEFIEPLLPTARLVLFGAGHVARAVGPIARQVGFEIALCDDGQTGALDGDLSFAEVVIPSFELGDVERELGGFGVRDFVVILTRDHAVDQRILEQALPSAARLGYLGVIGSRGKLGRFRKRIETRATLGFEHWHLVHGPIGLDIGAETPAEIAVSLLAELIRVRNGAKGTPA